MKRLDWCAVRPGTCSKTFSDVPVVLSDDSLHQPSRENISFPCCILTEDLVAADEGLSGGHLWDALLLEAVFLDKIGRDKFSFYLPPSEMKRVFVAGVELCNL